MEGYQSKPFLLDGATGTNLYLAGMPQGVCVEQWILDHPSAILNLQSAFVEAGSDAVLAPTFSANRAKLAHYGLSSKVNEMNRGLVALSREAAGSKAYVGADLSPTGLFLKPFGDTSFDELTDIYEEQVLALLSAGVDFFMLETQMSLSETRAAVLAVKKHTGLPVFATMTVDKKGKTLSGNSALACLVTLSGLGVNAFGLNCSTGPDSMLEVLRGLVPYSNIPLIAKPNAGIAGSSGSIEYLSPDDFAAYVPQLLGAGIHILGGCCGTTPEHIRRIRESMDRYEKPLSAKKPEPGAILAANEKEVFFFSGEPELSEPIGCDEDMFEAVMEIEENPCDAILMELKSMEDVAFIAENSYVLKLPLCVLAHEPALIEAMAVNYHGTLLIDSRSLADKTATEAIAARYGCIIL